MNYSFIQFTVLFPCSLYRLKLGLLHCVSNNSEKKIIQVNHTMKIKPIKRSVSRESHLGFVITAIRQQRAVKYLHSALK